MKSSRGFTLIELLVVISIIGLLASIVLTSLSSARAKARDAGRMATLRQLQNALELYASSNNGLYPVTFSGAAPSLVSHWFSTCPAFGSHTTSGASGYIPNLAPTYISVLPTDPTNPVCNAGYTYVSNGTDYMVTAYFTVESYTQATNPMKRPFQNGSLTPCNINTNYEADFAVYTTGATCW
ncbi:type II secretion system GspH family protein [Patescibacteria group bacterium]|nr:type II secretion system GspH family protein [Patescibacteria group bacterium]